MPIKKSCNYHTSETNQAVQLQMRFKSLIKENLPKVPWVNSVALPCDVVLYQRELAQYSLSKLNGIVMWFSSIKENLPKVPWLSYVALTCVVLYQTCDVVILIQNCGTWKNRFISKILKNKLITSSEVDHFSILHVGSNAVATSHLLVEWSPYMSCTWIWTEVWISHKCNYFHFNAKG